MSLYEIEGTYGSGKTESTILVYSLNNGYAWYCMIGSRNVNKCDEELLTNGVDVETLPDVDYFNWSSDIDELDTLEAAVDY